MQTHPALIERSVGATLRTLSRGQMTREEATLDLIELIASQIVGKTDYAMAVIGYYVRAVLNGYADNHIALADAFDAFTDAAAEAGHGHVAVSLRLSQPLLGLRH
ncbi:MAG: hypothetical protein QM647_06340 [Asticcacaulis sp.]|uniref:hypothetical protein n=1 Tax=Asticcacaulis sp. TaxID=1872648 RepID=UPI0039E417C5